MPNVSLLRLVFLPEPLSCKKNLFAIDLKAKVWKTIVLLTEGSGTSRNTICVMRLEKSAGRG